MTSARMREVGTMKIECVVLDFDGTIVTVEDRREPIPEDLAAQLTRLLDQARNGGPIMAPDFSHWRQRARWRRGQRHDAASVRRLSALETQLPAMPLDMDLRGWADGVARPAA